MKQVMNAEQISRTLKRITHEIIERNNQLEQLVLVGVLKKGHPIALLLKENLKRFADVDVPVYGLDITPHRDDLKIKAETKQAPFNIQNKSVILIDDVLYTGRSIRAAMDALNDYGRADQIQLAVLIDRGHRELPIRADYVGKNIPTSQTEKVVVDIEKEVLIIENK